MRRRVCCLVILVCFLVIGSCLCGRSGVWGAPVIGVSTIHLSDQSIPNNTSVTLSFSCTVHDPLGWHISQSTIEVGMDGWYFVFCGVRWASDADGYRMVQLVKDGTSVFGSEFVWADGEVRHALGVLEYLEDGEQITCSVKQTSGGSLNVRYWHEQSAVFRLTRIFESGGGTPGPHAASHENGGYDEIDVGGLDGVLSTPQSPAVHASSHEQGGADEVDVNLLDGILSTPQPPQAHVWMHETGGGDELDVTSLDGILSTPQPPAVHGVTHEYLGSDEIGVGGLSGVLTEAQRSGWFITYPITISDLSVSDVLAYDGSYFSNLTITGGGMGMGESITCVITDVVSATVVGLPFDFFTSSITMTDAVLFSPVVASSSDIIQIVLLTGLVFLSGFKIFFNAVRGYRL